MVDMRIKMEGVDALLLTLKEVSEDVRFKGGRFALRKAANVIEKELKEGAQRLDNSQTPNSIAKNVTLRFSSRLFKRTGNLGFRIGFLGGAKDPGDFTKLVKARRSAPGGDTFYWRFLEFGTESIAARPFVRPAFERNIGQASDEFVTQYKKALDRALRRAVKARSK